MTRGLADNQRVLVFLLLSIGLITFPHVNHIPLPIFAAFYLLLSWRFICIWQKNYLPNKALLLVVTTAAIFLLYQQYHSFLGRDAGTSLFVLALALKLLEIKKQRDLYLVNYLAFIVATSQFLFQQSILMAIYILLVTSVLLATLVSINSQKPKTIPALKTAAIIIFQALPISIILFVFFPRVEAPRWMMFGQQNSAKTGLSNSLEPGAISQLGLSDELVFRVKFEDELPPRNKLYWRGPVYSYTDGKKWSELKTAVKKHTKALLSYSGKKYQYTLMMEPQDKDWVFALDMPSAFPQQLKQNAQYQLINSKNNNKRAEYKISSYTQYNTGTINQQSYQDNIQLPDTPSDKLTQLVTRLHGFDQQAEYYIQSVLKYFRVNKFYYTLKPPLMGDQPIETFLFDKRYGFCSHYATAFVYLMRIAGIPARVVGGYQGGAFNQAGHFLEIKQANAHAWAEVWLKGKGWTRFDPTAAIAPERIEQDIDIDQQIATGLINFAPNINGRLPWMKQARQMWSTIDYSWQRWVINYSTENQSKFLSSFGLNTIKSIVYWLLACISIVTCLLAWVILKHKKVELTEEVKLYQLFCKKMSAIGLDKHNSETVQSFCKRIQKQRPDLAKKAIKITMIFTRLHYEKMHKDKDMHLLKQEIKNLKLNN